MSHLALGIMSGTSADGVSLALARFSNQSYKLLAYKTYPYPKELTQLIQNSVNLSIHELSTLNFEMGEVFSIAALEFLNSAKIKPSKLAVIGSHGQTVCHSPSGDTPSTLQIGESSVIAERTGVTVVSDFRPRDIAAGGEGAPLMPFFDHVFFGNGPPRCLLNIGGIANVAVVGGKIKKPLAFDTGPGNCLMDEAVSIISNGKKFYDSGGKGAAQGTIDLNLASEMLSHPFFKLRPPKATSRDDFYGLLSNPSLIRHLKNFPHNALATLTYFTALSIYQAHEKFILSKVKPQEIIVSGGGVYNLTLMAHLQTLFRSLKVKSIADFGIHPQAKEPLGFAYFALRAALGKINHLPSGTGAKIPRILGKITPGPRFKGIL